MQCYPLFKGDSPARAFEAGQQINGHFPCHCGVDIRNVMSHKALSPPKYKSSSDRMKKVMESSRWENRTDGDLAVYDNLDV